MTTAARQLLFLLEAVTDADGKPTNRLSGYASVYNRPYMGEYGPQMVGKNAFAEDIASKDGIIPIFYQHGWAKAANAVPIGYAFVAEDSKGLTVEAGLFGGDLPEAKAVHLAAVAGALREWSIGFLADETTLLDSKGKKELSASDLLSGSKDGLAPVERTDKGTLLEASVVVKGANPWTTLQAAEDGGLNQFAGATINVAAGGTLVLNGAVAASGDTIAPVPAGDELNLDEDAQATLDAERAERAWALLASATGRETFRDLCYDPSTGNNNHEVSQ